MRLVTRDSVYIPGYNNSTRVNIAQIDEANDIVSAKYAFTGYNPACGVCAMLRGGYVLWSGQNAITLSKQLDFKQQKQLKHPAMVPRNGDINKDAVHTLRSSAHPLFFSNTSRQFGGSKENFGDLSSFTLFSTFYTPSSVDVICKLF